VALGVVILVAGTGTFDRVGIVRTLGTQMSLADNDLDAMVSALNASGRYRVLRRLDPRPFIEPHDGSETRLGLFLDVETTGLDPTHDEIIELAMVPFTYSLDGRVFEIHEAFQKLRDPGRPIPPEITAITGITDEMVTGQTIDAAEVTAFASSAALVVAHNAAFDRRFAERLSEVFIAKPWACSMTQIDWSAEGFEGTKLAYLAMGAGFFYDRHRAKHDCVAAIELLATRLPKADVPAMAKLLARARRPNWRIWAENSPFDLKDRLKARGYRWNPDSPPNPRAWYIDVDDDTREQELAYLRTEIYQREIDLPTRRITAYERFSDRS
jgi:DNA polymerase-3 subunit epsilon